MRIAFVDYVLDPAKPGATGLSDLVWDIAPRLVEYGDEVHVIGPYTVSKMPDPRVRVHRFAIPPIGYRNLVGHLWIIWRAYQELLRLADIDVLHTPEYTSSAVITSLNRHIPVVFTEPGNIFERVERGNPYDFLTTQAYKSAARTTARNAAHLIATSEWMKEWWHRTGVPKSRITKIPLGIDTSLFLPIESARAMLGLAPDRKIILYAARLSRENGAYITFRACAALKNSFPNFDLHILGEGPEKERLKEFAREIGVDQQTYWHGWVDFKQLPLFYSAADVFAFSGFSGGTPRVMLQAMACGCPVVASAIGGIVDHIHDGVNGLLFDTGNYTLMGSHLLRLLEDDALHQAISTACLNYARANVDWDVLIPRIRAVYEQCKSEAHNIETALLDD